MVLVVDGSIMQVSTTMCTKLGAAGNESRILWVNNVWVDRQIDEDYCDCYAKVASFNNGTEIVGKRYF